MHSLQRQLFGRLTQIPLQRAVKNYLVRSTLAIWKYFCDCEIHLVWKFWAAKTTKCSTMQSNHEKSSTNQRRMVPRKKQWNKTSKAKPITNEDCLSPKMCRGKHQKYEPSESFVKNAEQLFKNQEVRIVNTVDECRAVISELKRYWLN